MATSLGAAATRLSAVCACIAPQLLVPSHSPKPAELPSFLAPASLPAAYPAFPPICRSPLLSEGDFEAKPSVLLLGQYSTGKSTFIKYLLVREQGGTQAGAGAGAGAGRSSFWVASRSSALYHPALSSHRHPAFLRLQMDSQC